MKETIGLLMIAFGVMVTNSLGGSTWSKGKCFTKVC
jgi:hypothetical protein